jgi:hypothetical protein
MALEYQYEQQEMPRMAREASFWAQTDGISFWHEFWNPNRGPWDERMAMGAGRPLPLGDLDCQTLLVEQVRVSPNATATIPPHWAVIREVISKEEAAWRYGVTGMDAADSGGTGIGMADATDITDWTLQQTNIGEGNRLRNVETVDRFTIYNSNLLPRYVDGTDATTHFLFGVDYGITFATQLTKTESLRAESTFGNIMRGLMVYGFKVIKPEAIGVVYATQAS